MMQASKMVISHIKSAHYRAVFPHWCPKQWTTKNIGWSFKTSKCSDWL